MDTTIDIIKHEYELQKQEQLNRIARALLPDYLDFKSIEDVEMSIDLGENLRVQMASIFKTLKKMGVDIESRR